MHHAPAPRVQAMQAQMHMHGAQPPHATHLLPHTTSCAVCAVGAVARTSLHAARRRLKSNVAQGCAGQEATWRHVNTQTQEALQRLGAAQQLVRSLGLGATGSGSGDV